MKNERVRVTAEMRDRIKDEINKCPLKEYEIAETVLYCRPGTFSRYLTGEITIHLDDIRKLAELWNVRKEYLLCMDNIRTDDEFTERLLGGGLSKRQRAIWNALQIYGYEFEYITEIAITPAQLHDIADTDNALNELSKCILSQPGEWEQFKEAVNNPKSTIYNVKHVFMIEEGNCELIELTAFVNYLDNYVKISRNDVCYGFMNSIDFVKAVEFMEISVSNLFDTFLYINRFDMFRHNAKNMIAPFRDSPHYDSLLASHNKTMY